MKILLIFTFFLISGPAACFDVIGYSRGSIIIYCNNKLSGNDGYFCKESTNQCVFLESAQRQNSWDHGGRVSLRNRSGKLRVFYQNLSLEDAGLYQCGETGGWKQTVNLRVKTDPCCLGPKTVIGHPEKTVTINCSYPEEIQTNTKIFYKQSEPYLSPVIWRGRFSISEDSRSRVVSVRIRDVREDDGGVYYCGALIGGNEVSYHLLYTEIHLQVSGKPATSVLTSKPPAPTAAPPSPTTTPQVPLTTQPAPSTIPPAPTTTPPAPTTTPPTPTTTPPTEPTSPTVTTSAPGSSIITTTIIIIIVSICVALLLIGGPTLICFVVILKKRRGSTPSTRSKHSENTEVPAVVSNDEETGLTTQTTPKDQELTYSTVSFHKNPGSPTDASVRISKEDSETEYATIKHLTALK